MGLGSLLKKLLGAGDSGQGDQAESRGEPIEYKGYEIFLQPRNLGGQFGVGGLIRKTVEGETREHVFIRADQAPSRDLCNEITLQKARNAIDSLGESLFKS
ncbi:HlyU family transcriptional regulator [Marinobacterium sedimentorum]|uniref:HlyU family transcriptional regulator n=1 Tax=Marinobacterium sedimentorum TaxID=2927804 RepID=UPI0020C6F6E2|nr:HlyU family transcriptional regulator [Marinobacterium sedimentorum]MCP8690267.1 HlyU family transcriptional regulator [Marinobacterium sedimentorum]